MAREALPLLPGEAARLERARARGARLFRAPGRVNIIGEHTDYSDGLVLPVNIGLYTWVEAMPRNDRQVRVESRNLGDSAGFGLDHLESRGAGHWVDYIKGVAAGLLEAGIDLPGIDLEIDGEIPLGGGLSSSASLEIALAVAMLAPTGDSLPAAELAMLCQHAERRYAGVHCGIMDQFSVAAGRAGEAMLLDCRSLRTEFIPLPAALAMIVTDSAVKHVLPASGYNDRHDECAEAVSRLAAIDAGVVRLRDASLDLLETGREQLGDTLYRRSRHVVTEIDRVRQAFEALRAGDIEGLGTLVSASHSSLRDDFEASCDAIETLVAIADSSTGVLGSRMVGGGFGGCVLSIVDADRARDAAAEISERYASVLGRVPWMHTVTPAAAAGEVTDP